MIPTKCKHVECNRSSGVYGVCPEHEPEAIRRYFMSAVKEGICSYDPPPCFKGDNEWREYVVAAMLCRNKSERQRAPIEYCRDCTPKFKDEMLGCGKCKHPETVFIRSERHGGDIIGVPVGERSTTVWESAVMGMAGEVVKLPSAEVIGDALTKIAKDAEPKKRGPRFRKDRLSG